MIPGPPRKRRRWAALLRARLPVHEDRGPLGAREGARRLERAGVGAVEDARRHRAATSSSKRNMRFRGSKRGRFGKKLLLGDRVSAGTSAGADTGVDGGVGAGARAVGVIRHSTSHEHAIWDRIRVSRPKTVPYGMFALSRGRAAAHNRGCGENGLARSGRRRIAGLRGDCGQNF